MDSFWSVLMRMNIRRLFGASLLLLTVWAAGLIGWHVLHSTIEEPVESELTVEADTRPVSTRRLRPGRDPSPSLSPFKSVYLDEYMQKKKEAETRRLQKEQEQQAAARQKEAPEPKPAPKPRPKPKPSPVKTQKLIYQGLIRSVDGRLKAVVLLQDDQTPSTVLEGAALTPDVRVTDIDASRLVVEIPGGEQVECPVSKATVLRWKEAPP